MSPRKRLSELHISKSHGRHPSLGVIDEDAEFELPDKQQGQSRTLPVRPQHDPGNDKSVSPSTSVKSPPSRRRTASDRQLPSAHDVLTEQDLLAMKSAGESVQASRHRVNHPRRKHPPQQSPSAQAAPEAQPWSPAFSGVPRSASQPGAFPPGTAPESFYPSQPVLFVGLGQVTYVGKTEYNANIRITLFWKDNLAWGKFDISDGSGNGYLRTKFEPEWKPVKDGGKVTFHWRGLSGNQKVPSSDSNPWIKCTTVKIEFLSEGDEIKGEMHPMDNEGRVRRDEQGSVKDNMFTFDATRQAGSTENGDAEWDGWDVFGPDK